MQSRATTTALPITETALPSATAESAEGSVALDSQEASVEHRPVGMPPRGRLSRSRVPSPSPSPRPRLHLTLALTLALALILALALTNTHQVHMPPEANHDDRMDHLLRALEAQHELRAGLDQVLESIGMMSTERSSAQPSPQVLDLLGKVSRDIEALKHRAPAEGEAAGASGNEASKGVEALASEVVGSPQAAAIEEMPQPPRRSCTQCRPGSRRASRSPCTMASNQVTDCRKEMSKLQTASELRSQSSSWVLFLCSLCTGTRAERVPRVQEHGAAGPPSARTWTNSRTASWVAMRGVQQPMARGVRACLQLWGTLCTHPGPICDPNGGNNRSSACAGEGLPCGVLVD